MGKNKTKQTVAKSYLKNSYPGIANVIKINSSIVRVYIPCLAYVVILVPVYASAPVAEIWVIQILVVGVHAQGALHPVLLPVWDIGAFLHAVIPMGRADEWILLPFRLVIRLP